MIPSGLMFSADINGGGHVKDPGVLGVLRGGCGDVGLDLIKLFFLHIAVE